MEQVCTAPAEPGFVTSLLADTDCQAFGLVERGYAALSSPGSATVAATTSLMVIAVAFFGYRLMLGRGLALRDVTSLAVKLGVVLLLTASWGSFQGVFYDAFARAPTRIAEDVIVAIDAPAPLSGLQLAHDKIEAASVGWRQRAGIASPLVGGPPATAMTLNVASFLLTLTTLGLLVISRVVLALLLAVTPVIAGFLLFDVTRGLVEGWLRALIAAALVPLAVLIVSSIELAIVMPILDRILAQEAAGQFLEESVVPLGLVTIVFSLAILASVAALRSIGRGIRLPASRPRDAVIDVAAPLSPRLEPAVALSGGRTYYPEQQPSVVRALESAERREARDTRAHAGPSVVQFTRDRSSPRAPAASSSAIANAEARGVLAVAALATHPRQRGSRSAKRRDS